MSQLSDFLGSEHFSAVIGRPGERVLDSLSRICPDIERYIVEFAYGEIHQRPGLTLQQRELTIIVALATLGHCEPQLRIHLEVALRAGVSRTEIVEALLQLAVYAGFPTAINALWAAQAVFDANPEEPPRYD
jgi:4-carboxymuconolactone decarboxylase